ncbi:MAG: DUF58 domain-containing protein [Deltaproteobacteria bacterium]|nr:DUF58 domain-containing protein [Deltaproteobacteria bacterium]
MTSANTALLLDPSEVEAINLFCNARVRDLIFGEHASVFTGTAGFDFSGIRDFQSGDPQIKVDWAHSTTTLFNPLQVRECIEERSIGIVIAADVSCSTRFGASGEPIGKGIARTIATIGLSASIFQDMVGLVLFGGKKHLIEPPGGGRNQVERMVDLYQTAPAVPGLPERERLADTLAGELRRTSLVIVASDFLFPDVFTTLKELADLKQPHDLFLVMADSAFAFELPEISAGWIGCVDSETGARVELSYSQVRELPRLIRNHQDAVEDYAERMDLEVLRVLPDAEQFQSAIVDFFLERRLRRS